MDCLRIWYVTALYGPFVGRTLTSCAYIQVHTLHLRPAPFYSVRTSEHHPRRHRCLAIWLGGAHEIPRILRL